MVQLPEQGSSWELGPASVRVLSASREPQSVTAPAIRVGRKRASRGLVGQGGGSGFVVRLVLVWAALRDRQLGLLETGSAREEFRTLLDLADPEEPLACLQRLVELGALLESRQHPVDGLPDLTSLRERLDRVRFGGESISVSECRDVRAAFLAALED